MVQQAAVEAAWAPRRPRATQGRCSFLLAEAPLSWRTRVAVTTSRRWPRCGPPPHLRQQGERGHVAHALWVLGDITARQGSVGAIRAEEYYEEAASAPAEELGMRPLGGARCSSRPGAPCSTGRRASGARPAFEFLAFARAGAISGASADPARPSAELAAEHLARPPSGRPARSTGYPEVRRAGGRGDRRPSPTRRTVISAARGSFLPTGWREAADLETRARPAAFRLVRTLHRDRAHRRPFRRATLRTTRSCAARRDSHAPESWASPACG